MKNKVFGSLLLLTTGTLHVLILFNYCRVNCYFKKLLVVLEGEFWQWLDHARAIYINRLYLQLEVVHLNGEFNNINKNS